MTKAQEIDILEDAAEKLGPGSYCGTWLKNQIPFIESSIRSDVFPEVDWNTALNRCADILERAKQEAAAIKEKAEKEAEELAQRALDYHNRTLDNLRGTMMRAVRELDK